MRRLACRMLAVAATSAAVCAAALVPGLTLLGGQVRQAPRGEATSLARYFPRENLLVYAEFQGLAAHQEGWSQTAAHDILTRTSTGSMIVSLFQQLVPATVDAGTPTRDELARIAAHLIDRGFAFGITRAPGDARPSVVAFVARDLGAGATRELIDRVLNGARQKAESQNRSGRQIFARRMGPGAGIAWWFEHDDLVISLNAPAAVDAILSTLDAAGASAIEHPRRLQLAKRTPDFEPVGVAFFEMSALPPLPPDLRQLGLDSLQRVEYQWGFSGKAIKTVTHLAAPGPRMGMFATLDQPTFRVADLPPMPAGLGGFTSVSVSLSTTLAKLLSQPQGTPTSPAARTYEDVQLNIRENTGLDLDRDLVAPLGPLFTVYHTTKTGVLPDSPIAGLVRGMLATPRYALVTKVKDPAAYAGALDRIMPELNKDLANAPSATFSGPGLIRHETVRPLSNVFEERVVPFPTPAPIEVPKATVPEPKAERPRRGDVDRALVATVATAVAADGEGEQSRPHFVKLAEPRRGWTMSHPVGSLLSGLGARPTIEVGNAYLTISSSPALARDTLALQGPPGPPADDPLRGALEGLPDSMVMLSVNDPRQGILPELLGNLPSLVNAVSQLVGLSRRGEMGGPGLPGVFAPLLGVSPVAGVTFADPPDPDAVRAFLFPSRAVLSARAEGFTLETVDAFPVLNPSAVAPVAGALFFTGFSSQRLAATRAQSTNNLKQIGLAVHNFLDTHGRLPADIKDQNGTPILSWRVEILPFLEEQQTFNQIHRDQPWDSEGNKAFLETMPRVFEIPGSPAAEVGSTFYRGFASPVSGFDPTAPRGIGLQDFTDGTSNTILVVEAREAVPWTKPGTDIPFDHDVAPDQARLLVPELGGHFAGGFNALFMDGSVRFIRETVSRQVLRALITRNGGEVVSSDSF